MSYEEVKEWVVKHFSTFSYTVEEEKELLELLIKIKLGEHTYWNACNEEDLEKLLDMEIVGEPLAKLWELCDKSEYLFSYHISLVPDIFTKEQILSNFLLENPILFFENFDEFITSYQLDDKEYVNSIARFQLAQMKRNVRNQFVIRYNETCEKEGSHNFLSLEGEIPVKQIMNPMTKVDVNEIYYGTREDITNASYPMFLKNEHRFVNTKTEIYQVFTEVPYLDTYYIPTVYDDFSNILFEPYQSYEEMRDDNFAWIHPLMSLVKNTKQNLMQDMDFAISVKWKYLTLIELFLSKIDDDFKITVRDLTDFHELFSFCNQYLYNTFITCPWREETSDKVYKS